MTLTRRRLIARAFAALPALTVSLNGAWPGSAAAPEAPAFATQVLADHPLAGRVVHGTSLKPAHPIALLQALEDADIVILGEIHDNPDHHRLQAWLYDLLTRGGRRLALALEMVPIDRQNWIDAHLFETGGDVADLGKAVRWAERGWPDWAMYAPIAQLAADRMLPILAANAPERQEGEVREAGLDAALPPARRSALALAEGTASVPAPVFDALVQDMVEGHCNLVPADALAPMAQVQLLRDAVMAEALHKAQISADTDGVVLIAGAGHGRLDRGVPFHLRRRDAGLRIVSVAFREVTRGTVTAADEAGDASFPFDFVWFTPRSDEIDHCAALREHFGQTGAATDK